MGDHSITHQLCAQSWREDLSNKVTITPGLFWREIWSEPDERGRFLITWKDGDPDSAFSIGRNGELLEDPEIIDTVIGIVRLWEAENPCLVSPPIRAITSLLPHASAPSDGEGGSE